MDQIKTDIDARGGFCTEMRSGPCGVIIFGASGDLTYRKLIPALYNLFKRELLPENFFVLGCARTPMSNEEFQAKARESVKIADQSILDAFIGRFSYCSGDYNDSATYVSISQKLDELDRIYATKGNRLFYFAIPPDFYSPITNMLGSVGLVKETDDGKSFIHVILEKPFGRDFESALSLDKELHFVLSERQIYRIDHYLGKETVQNILMFRFANAVFEPIWNRRYIDHVQITGGAFLHTHRQASRTQAE